MAVRLVAAVVLVAVVIVMKILPIARSNSYIMQLDIDRKGFITTNDIRCPAQNRTLILRQSQLREPTMLHGGSSASSHCITAVHPPAGARCRKSGRSGQTFRRERPAPPSPPKPAPHHRVSGQRHDILQEKGRSLHFRGLQECSALQMTCAQPLRDDVQYPQPPERCTVL